MKALRSAPRVHVLVITLVLGVVATTGGVRSADMAPAATPAAGSDGTPAVQSFFDIFLEIEGIPGETLELSFNGVKLTYTQFDATGKPVGQTTAEW